MSVGAASARAEYSAVFPLQVRETFPSALIVYHTACMVRHRDDTGRAVVGPNNDRRLWISRMSVSQVSARGQQMPGALVSRRGVRLLVNFASGLWGPRGFTA